MIKLTSSGRRTDRNVYINPDKIVAIFRINGDTRIDCAEGLSYLVEESVGKVLEEINK